LFGDGGESMSLDAHQQLMVTGRHLMSVSVTPPLIDTGDFDRWVAERERIDDESLSARYVSREMPGYQQLDAYGDWQSDPAHGQVWYPRNVDAGWAPYQSGHWIEIAPWGWTWIDAAPWGFAPMHYGQWTRIGARWGWVPGAARRPVYASAPVGMGVVPMPLRGGHAGRPVAPPPVAIRPVVPPPRALPGPPMQRQPFEAQQAQQRRHIEMQQQIQRQQQDAQQRAAAQALQARQRDEAQHRPVEAPRRPAVQPMPAPNVQPPHQRPPMEMRPPMAQTRPPPTLQTPQQQPHNRPPHSRDQNGRRDRH
jgi:hypothetical protein